MSADAATARHPVRSTPYPGLVPALVVARGALRGGLIWGAVFGLLIVVEVSQYGSEYPTAADRSTLAATMGANAGLQAIFGIARQLDTVGGYVAFHAIGLLGMIGAIWGLLTATRLLRGEEESGRWEVLLAGLTARRSAAGGALAGLATGLLSLWAVTAAATIAVGRSQSARFTVTGSLFLALTVVAAAAMFAAVGAVCSQLAGTRRRAAAIAAAIFAVAYLTRLVAYSDASLLWLHWASPLGWADELRPLTGSRPLLLIPITAFVMVLATATVLLAGRRDLGASMLPANDTATASTRLLTGPIGLAARLTIRSSCTWVAGLAVGGFVLGLTAKGARDLTANRVGGVAAKLGGTAGGTSYLGIGFLIIAIVAGLAAGAQLAAIREEEAEGYLDHLLARPVSRLSWLTSRLAVSAATLIVAVTAAGLATWAGAAATSADQGLTTMLAASTNAVPAGLFVLGAGTLIYGLAPRYALTAAYAIVAWSFLVEIIGASVATSSWLLDLSVLHHLARAPAVPVNWGGAAIVTAIGIAAAGAGAAAFARRDLVGA